MVSIVDNSSCPEGGACVFSITSDTAGSTAISGTWTTSNGTAVGGSTCTAGIDFVSGSGTWNISASSSTANLGPTVTICTDGVAEAAETTTEDRGKRRPLLSALCALCESLCYLCVRIKRFPKKREKNLILLPSFVLARITRTAYSIGVIVNQFRGGTRAQSETKPHS